MLGFALDDIYGHRTSRLAIIIRLYIVPVRLEPLRTPLSMVQIKETNLLIHMSLFLKY